MALRSSGSLFYDVTLALGWVCASITVFVLIKSQKNTFYCSQGVVQHQINMYDEVSYIYYYQNKTFPSSMAFITENYPQSAG
jgi:hypothetical protein